MSALLSPSSNASAVRETQSNAALDERLAARTWASTAILRQPPQLEGKPVVISDAAFSAEIPFSFIYGGKPSAGLLPSWKRSVKHESVTGGKEQHVITWLDPETGLRIDCEVTIYADYPAVEWVLRLTNTGSADTPIIANILPLDMAITPQKENGIKLHYVMDSNMSEADYTPHDCVINPGFDITLAHNVSIPYFSAEWIGGGVVGAIGWTGPWSLRLRRGLDARLSLQAGQLITRLKLHPGESIRTPRILLVSWQGQDRMRGHNALRRLLMDHYVPKQNGQIAVTPISYCPGGLYEMKCKDPRKTNRNAMEEVLNGVTEENQLDSIRRMPSIGIEAFWIDAGWYLGDYSNTITKGGLGNWRTPKPEAFPRGLKPISDAAKQKGMKFILWFCPELVNPESEVGREHPEWVSNYTFLLGNPEARQWMTDLLSDCIAKWGVDIYRDDGGTFQLPLFKPLKDNTSPIAPVINPTQVKALESPQEQIADPDRQGIAEIRHIEGLYAMWDELLRRHPGLMIDNANWRGKGCDIELVKRTVGSLLRSEATFWGDKPAQDQMGTMTLSQYVPISGSGAVKFDPYFIRSAATSGIAFPFPWPDLRDKDFPVEEARKAIAEVISLRPYWLGDFYPLIERIDADESNWCAWQFHRPDLDAGFAVFFRRSKSPLVSIDCALRGLDPAMKYEVVFKETFDVKEKRVMSGAELRALRVEIGNAPGSVLVMYKKRGPGRR